MHQTKQKLLNEVLRFCRRNGVTPTEFGKRAVNNSALVTRLKNPEAGLTLKTISRVEQFIAGGRS